jgi:hypothetical protein
MTRHVNGGLGTRTGFLTEVTICHASRDITEMNIQRMYVDSRDTMRVKKMELENSCVNVNWCSPSSSFTAL